MFIHPGETYYTNFFGDAFMLFWILCIPLSILRSKPDGITCMIATLIAVTAFKHYEYHAKVVYVFSLPIGFAVMYLREMIVVEVLRNKFND